MNLGDWGKQGTEAYNYLKGIGNKVKQIALQLTEVEVKVEDATNNEPWGPHGKDMAEITKAAYELESYKQIMGVIARRLQDQGEDWRHVYKSLLLLEYMAKHGPQKVVEELVSNVTVIEKLTFFDHKDANGKDWGLNVRQRAKELVALINDPERMRAERHKAKANETKYTGVSSEDVRSGGFGHKSSGLSSSSTSFGSSMSGGKYRSGGGLGSSGLGSGSGRAGASLYDDYDEPYAGRGADKDPKEATRERIERLRREGAVSIEEPGHDKGSLPPALKPALKPGRAAAAEANAEATAARGPKKLSDVKVNPSIAASLGALPLPAPGAAAAATNGSNSAKPAAAAAPSAADLLLELDGPGMSSPAAPSGASEDASWSAFAGGNGAAHAPAPSMDPFAALSAPSPASHPAPSTAAAADPFADPFAPPAKAPAAPALAAGLSSGVLSEDLFSAAPAPMLGGMQAHPQQQQQQGSFDLFAQSSGQQMGWQQQQQQQPHPQPFYGQQQQPRSGMQAFGGFQNAAAPAAQLQASFGAMGLGGATPAPAGQGKPPGQASTTLTSANTPLNPAATPIVSSRTKDPFADLAAF